MKRNILDVVNAEFAEEILLKEYLLIDGLCFGKEMLESVYMGFL